MSSYAGRGSIEAQLERGLIKLAAAQDPLPQCVDDQVEELIDALRCTGQERCGRLQGEASQLSRYSE